MDRQGLELLARRFHDSGCRIESTPGLGRNTAKLNRFLKALQQELIHSEGWPTAG